jgi:hypothetical protein
MLKISLLFVLGCQIILAQQIGDSTYNPVIKNPAYTKPEGPVVFIDEGHNNFHTMSGRYKPFAEILQKDGYNVKPYLGTFSITGLDSCKIIVVSNALNQRNTEEWTLPTPSAFTGKEIDQIVEWVGNGGSLFLIADHMPFPGAASELAEKFGFKLNNGFAFDTSKQASPDLFTRKDKTLGDNFITNGRNESERVDSIYSFTGEGFPIPEDAAAVLVLNKNFICLMPDTAWDFRSTTPKISAAGWSQGAVKKYGRGRVAVWGEAAMFSAQVANDQKFGLNAPYAKDNLQLLLNIIHWLDGKID